jgi:hypothetical protein
VAMVNGKDKQKRKPTKKELEAEFDKMAQFLFDLYRKAKLTSLQK